eukprot:jgi/Ulvmu1/7857/UM004_0088.1
MSASQLAYARARVAGRQMHPFRAAVKAQMSARGMVRAHAQLEAVIFDCDGVILESEDLHRRAYNAAFANFDVKCNGEPVEWSEEFYDELQNTVGGGKPKMRWYFSPDRNGWPTSSILPDVPGAEDEQAVLIDTLQDWKSEEYQRLIGSGDVPPRPGVLRLMDEARAAGYKVAVCSAATKESVIFTLNSLLGPDRFNSLDCFMAGDDVPRKKPDPIIYQLASERLGVDPCSCVVIEDSTIGLNAALGAGMRCVVTYTPSTRAEPFEGAEVVVSDLGAAFPRVELHQIAQGDLRFDDRAASAASA